MGIEKLRNTQIFNSSGLKAFSSKPKFNKGDFLEILLKLLGESSVTSNYVRTAKKIDENSLSSKEAILPINLIFPNTQVEYYEENISEKNLSNFPNDISKDIPKNIENTDESLNLFDKINLENLKDYGINIKLKLHNRVDKEVFYSLNFQTKTLTSKGRFERKESKSGEIYHAVQVEIKELPQESMKVQESEKSLMLKDFRMFEKDGEKRVMVKFNELGFEIRFLRDTAKLRFTLNQQLANFITSYDAVRISQIFQSFGVKLESVNINGQEIYNREKNKDKGNIKVNESTHKSDNTYGYGNSFSIFL